MGRDAAVEFGLLGTGLKQGEVGRELSDSGADGRKRRQGGSRGAQLHLHGVEIPHLREGEPRHGTCFFFHTGVLVVLHHSYNCEAGLGSERSGVAKGIPATQKALHKGFVYDGNRT